MWEVFLLSTVNDAILTLAESNFLLWRFLAAISSWLWNSASVYTDSHSSGFRRPFGTIDFLRPKLFNSGFILLGLEPGESHTLYRPHWAFTGCNYQHFLPNLKPRLSLSNTRLLMGEDRTCYTQMTTLNNLMSHFLSWNHPWSNCKWKKSSEWNVVFNPSTTG